MKKVLLPLLLVLLVASFTQAADDIHAMTAQGDKALLFSVSGLGYFGVDGNQAGMSPLTMYMLALALEGNSDEIGNINLSSSALYSRGLGFLYYFGDNMAFRFGMSYASVTGTQEFNEEDDGYDGEFSMGISMLSIAPGVQYHLVNTGRISIYTGGELFYGSTSITLKEEMDSDKTEESVSFNGFGVAGLIGAQFYPWKNVSLGAEYKLGYASFSMNTESDNGDEKVKEDGPSISALGINTWGVTLGFHF